MLDEEMVTKTEAVRVLRGVIFTSGIGLVSVRPRCSRLGFGAVEAGAPVRSSWYRGRGRQEAGGGHWVAAWHGHHFDRGWRAGGTRGGGARGEQRRQVSVVEAGPRGEGKGSTTA
jgi:hypothetical protein